METGPVLKRRLASLRELPARPRELIEPDDERPDAPQRKFAHGARQVGSPSVGRAAVSRMTQG